MKPTTREYVVTAIITIIFSLIAFWAFYKELEGLGYTMFIITPICVGFYVGKRPGWLLPLYLTALLTLIFFVTLLMVMALEGMGCVIMSLPIIFIGSFVGLWIGYFVSDLANSRDKKNDIKLAVYPLLILLFSGVIEHYFLMSYDHGKVTSKIVLPYSKEKVYDFIKSVDTLDAAAEKPFMFSLGLPLPQKCVLEKEDTGAQRTCYFDAGIINEKVVEMKRGEILKMEVTSSTLPDIKWLKFQDAIYQFEEKDGKTILTRTTTYSTTLKPRFYWRFWEKQSIAAEHEFVLHDLEQRLAKDAARKPGTAN